MGATATDLVLTATQMLRKKGVVEKFVEFYGPGLAQMSLADRATVANMAPEYGATCGFFPIDAETLGYLRRTGRAEAQVDLVERYCKEQGLFRTDASPDPVFSDTLELNLADVEPSLSGPKRPQDRVPVRDLKMALRKSLTAPVPTLANELMIQSNTRVTIEITAAITWFCDSDDVNNPIANIAPTARNVPR